MSNKEWADSHRDLQKGYQKAHYARNRQRLIQEAAERKRRNARWLAEYKKKLKCSRCPEDHPACLDFHHRDPDAKIMSICNAANSGWGVEKILEEMAKCDVLCSNCHRKEHAG